jgi:uncharacterized protein
VVKPGQIVKVKVLEVDVKRQRISLTMRLAETPKPSAGQPRRDEKPRSARPPEARPASAMALAFAKLKK